MISVHRSGHEKEFTTRTSRAAFETCILPVTALCYALGGSLLLAGRGGFLTVYDCQTCRLLSQSKLFDTHAIHGIITYHVDVGSYVVLAWAGPAVSALLLSNSSYSIAASESSSQLEIKQLCESAITCSDWILDCAFAPRSSGLAQSEITAVAVTAHNALTEIVIRLPKSTHEINASVPSSISQEELSHASRSLLYSAHITWLGATKVCVAAGTAFGTVIIWSCQLSAEAYRGVKSITTHYAFTGHADGAIFGIHLFAEPQSPATGVTGVILATCSDDRTIKVWDVSKINDVRVQEVRGGHDSPMLSSLPQPENDVNGEDEEHTAKCLGTVPPGRPKSLRGHISRVWGIKALKSEHAVTLASIGEDASCQLWKFQQRAQSTGGVLSHISTFTHHSGKSVWSFASVRDLSDTAYFACGGADGRIATWTTHCSTLGAQPTIKSRSSALLEQPPVAEENIKTYDFMGRQMMLAITSTGSVLVKPVDPSSRIGDLTVVSQWTQLGHNDALSNYSVLSTIPERQLGFVGDSNGDVFFISPNGIFPEALAAVKGKVGAIFVQSIASPLFSTFDIILLATGLGPGETRLRQINSAKPTGPGDAIGLKTDFVVTAMHHVEVSADLTLVMLGSRDGAIYAYVLEWACADQESVCNAVNRCRSHEDAVTQMSWQLSVDRTCGFLLSTSRDGTYNIHEYTVKDMAEDPKLVHRLTLPLGSYVEGFYFALDGSLSFYGFQSEHFVVYNENKQQELARIECGGAHRTWAFQVPCETESEGRATQAATFVWTRASSVNIAAVPARPYSCIESGSHGREIKASAASPVPFIVDGRTVSLIATGAEDTDIRLFAYTRFSSTPSGSSLSCVRIIKEHNTGLQALKWSRDGRSLFSCGGREEFFIWRVQPVPFVGVGVVRESALPPETSMPDLRIMGFDVAEKNSSRDDVDFMITMVLSNSSIRTYHYSRQSDRCLWKLLSTNKAGDHCLTTANFLSYGSQEPSREPLGLVTAGTNGAYDFWTAYQWSNEIAEHRYWTQSVGKRIHQNTIKDVSISKLPNSPTDQACFVLLTVGDDNALAVTLLRLSTIDHDSNAEASTLVVPRAHAASATAIETLGMTMDTRGGVTVYKIRLATASNDQRLKIWDIALDTSKPGSSGIEVNRVMNVASGVADISSLVVLPCKEESSVVYDEASEREISLLVCGVGLEAWRIPMKD